MELMYKYKKDAPMANRLHRAISSMGVSLPEPFLNKKMYKTLVLFKISSDEVHDNQHIFPVIEEIAQAGAYDVNELKVMIYNKNEAQA